MNWEHLPGVRWSLSCQQVKDLPRWVARPVTDPLPQSERTNRPKLHARTGPYSADRARDVLDILLIELLVNLYVKKVQAVEQVFEERAIRAFPPTVQIVMEWKQEPEVRAKELGCSATSATEIEAMFRAFVDYLAKA